MDIYQPTYDEIHTVVDELAFTIKQQATHFDLIVGIARGGLVPAVILSHLLKIPMTTIAYSSSKGKGTATHKHGKIVPNFDSPILLLNKANILLVDDIADSGHSLREILNSYSGRYQHNFLVLTLYYKTSSIFVPDFYGINIPQDAPFVNFPWENNE